MARPLDEGPPWFHLELFSSTASKKANWRLLPSPPLAASVAHVWSYLHTSLRPYRKPKRAAQSASIELASGPWS